MKVKNKTDIISVVPVLQKPAIKIAHIQLVAQC